jgi:hypothetical protein
MTRIDLPLRHVALFSSGVGFFSRAANISGAGECELLFKSGQINDILKSLVLLDPHGGARHVSYDAQEDASKYLQEAGIKLDPGTSLANILRGFQGVECSMKMVDGRALTGRIISVHTRHIKRENETADSTQRTILETLSVLGQDGITTVPLEDVASLQVLDEARRSDFANALQMLGAERGGERRAVRIHFESDKPEEREVRVNYGHEVPLWKTSYRLVLGESAPFLQGWAIVENTGEEDWENVELSLVAGRPISFVQDLYSPLHAHRPRVAPQIIESPLPQLYEQVLEDAPAPRAPASGMAMDHVEMERTRGGGAVMRRSGFFAMGGSEATASAPAPLRAESSSDMFASHLEAEEMGGSAAQGSERGELFEYAIAHPVSIARRTSALVPIVGGSIEGEKLSIYNPDVFPRALRGFLLKNTSGVHLAGGPMTIFDDGLYAGDAQVADITPGDSRLLSYAVDLDIIARHEERTQPNVQIALKAVDGVLRWTTRMRRVSKFEFRNTGSKARTILVQRPLDSWSIVSPEYEKTPGEARFRVPIEPGQKINFEVVREKKGTDTFHLSNATETQILEVASHDLASPALRAALEELAAMKKAEAQARAREAAPQRQISAIEKEQERIRANMDKLDRKSALYLQYVSKLTSQEQRIEELRGQLESAQAEVANAQETVAEFVRNFNFE